MSKFKAVVFDIDGTLTPQTSWTAFTRDIGASVDEHLEIFHSHLNGKIGLDESKARLLKIWQATGNASSDHIEKVFDKWPVRHGAIELIDSLKKKYKIVLITGSVGIYAKHMAEKLGADDYYANAELFFDKDGKLEGFHYTTDQAAVKLKQLKNYCKKNNLTPKECIPIGDSDNDIDLFKITGNGILVNFGEVSEELRESAWKIVDSLSEVRQYI